MSRMHRVVLLVGLVALTPVLSACADFDMDKLDVFGLNEKKKLPGERKEVFPEGVPGVSQGIPPEFIKGNQPPTDAAQANPTDPDNKAATAGPAKKTAAVESAGEPKPKAKPKRKPKPAATAAQSQPANAGQQQAPAQWPADGQSTSSTGAAPWPSAPAPGN
jgi:hypothetical protein